MFMGNEYTHKGHNWNVDSVLISKMYPLTNSIHVHYLWPQFNLHSDDFVVLWTVRFTLSSYLMSFYLISSYFLFIIALGYNIVLYTCTSVESK